MFDRNAINEFERGGQALRHAVAGLSRQDLLAHPVPGTWSIQEIVIHLMDSDLIGIDRMKRVIAEDRPLLIGYNESRLAKSLAYDHQSSEDAITVFDMSRKLFAPVLRGLPEAAFDRWGVHNEHGKVTLADFVKNYVEHLNHHLKFIRDKRAKIGKALKD